MSEEKDKKNENENSESMVQKSQEVKSPSLTLNPDDVEYDMSFMEPSLEKALEKKPIRLTPQQAQWMNRCCLTKRKNRWRHL